MISMILFLRQQSAVVQYVKYNTDGWQDINSTRHKGVSMVSDDSHDNKNIGYVMEM